jgi:hypothetical protein
MPVVTRKVAMTAPSTEPTPSTPAVPAGATPPAAAPTTPETPPAKPEDGLGDAGKKALQAEREARKALEQQIGELKPLLDFVQQIRGGLAVPESQKTEADKLTARLAEVEKTASEERMLRLRLEVATEKGLTPAQAARLAGTSKEELTADAEALLTLFPAAAAPPATPGTPRPDPSQGVRSAGPPSLDALIAEAESKGDTRAAIQLKARKLITNK